MLRPFSLLLFVITSAWAFSPEELQLSAEARGVMAHSCTKCHGQQKQKGGLRLDTREAAMKGGDDGVAIMAGKAAESDLLRRVALPHGHEEAMPPKNGTLESADVETLRKWIAAGAPWPDGETAGIVFQRAPIAPRKPEFPAGTDELANPVDKFVAAYFRERNFAWPQSVDDRTFLRRASLDLLGLQPTWEEARAFSGDREKAVDALLARKEDYAAHWLTTWNDALRNDYSGTGYIDGGRRQISQWLYAALRDEKPFDVFVRELVAPPSAASDGFIKGIVWRGSVSAAQARELQAAQSVAQVFLGLNLKCASCHDSFISDYKLRDAYELAAVFADHPLNIARCDKPTGEQSGPAFFWPELGTIDAAKPRAERQQQLAALLTKKENGRLARTLVNRLWASCFGRALVEPVDSMDNKPWSQDLLDWLAWDFAENGWSVKHTLRLITTSRTYALPSVAVADADALGKSSFVFYGPIVRRLSAEEFTDAVSRVASPLYAKRDLGGENADAALAKAAAWIWHGEGTSQVSDFPMGKRYFRTSLELPAGRKVLRAAVVGTADNTFTLYVNGRETLSSTAWEVARGAEVTELFVGAKSVTLAVVADNIAPGAAGLRMAFGLWLEGQKAPLIVETGPGWFTSASGPEGWEKPGFDDRAWDSAVVVTMVPIWDTTREFRLTSEPMLVRASLVENDALQAALGRPIRDQVTMGRASQATLLQALTLTNGRTFTATLDRAAILWEARVPDPKQRLCEIYRAALLRDPRPEELAFANSATGDVLWSLLLQPEFQLIR